jgi:hypothetical protein
VEPCLRINQVTGGLECATTPHLIEICFALVRYDDTC